MLEITLDIETIPCQSEDFKSEILESARANIKAPSSLTKEQAAIDLGMTDKDEIKYTSKDAMIARWLSVNGDEAAKQSADEIWRKTSFDGALGHICVIGYVMGDSKPVAFYAKDETELLHDFFHEINAICALHPNERPRFIGHNLVDFDLRFIQQRAMILGAKPSQHIPFNAKPWDDSVFDTMQRWDAKNRTSLDKLSKAFGLQGKNGIDGSMVCDMYTDGKIREIAEYCCDDVELTRDVYKRMTFQ